MTDNLATDILNELIGLELQGLAIRAIESTTFVSGLSQAEEPLVRKLAMQHRSNAARLADVVSSLGATPGMRNPDATTGDLHFVDLAQVLPRIVDYQQKLVRLYEAAGQRLSDTPSASNIVSDIALHHVLMLAELQAQANKTSNASS